MVTNWDTIHIIFLCSLDFTALLANGVLVFAILTRTPQPMRSYSILLLNNCFVDICSAIVSAMGVASLVQVEVPSSLTTASISMLLYIPTVAMLALTYQLLLPAGQAVAVSTWLLNVANIWPNEIAERLIMIINSLFALGSPLINLTFLPPYRRMFSMKSTT
ncbi:hypothetical protein PMAYCL1PPCAC_08475, partial [Pristionchus mayeri]